MKTWVLHEWERGVLFRHGLLVTVLAAGRHRRFRRGYAARVVDLRPWVMVVPAQEVLTSDGTTVKVTVTARVRVADPVAYVTKAQEPVGLLYLALQLALRTVVGGVTLEDLVAGRGDLGDALMGALGDVAEVGLVVERTEVKDVILPAELKRAQAEVLVERARGIASLERARGETAALRSLANAARIASENPALLQLRLLQELGGPGVNTVVVNGPTS